MLIPLGDRVVIEPIVNGEVLSEGGLILTTEAHEMLPTTGMIISAGIGRRDSEGKLVPMDLKVGQKVLFSRHAGTECEVEGNKVKIMRELEVIGVLQD